MPRPDPDDGPRLSPLFTWRSVIVDSDLAATVRHVALTLSLHMNERGGSCFPSIATLARETGRTPRTVTDALSALEAHGFLAREFQRRGEGRGTRVEYRATTRGLTTGGPERPPADSPHDHLRFDDTTTCGETAGVESDIESDSEVVVTRDPLPGVSDKSDVFDRFWTAYPRKVGKPRARTAFTAAVKRDGLDAIKSGFARWRDYWRAAQTAPSFIPHASTWLNDQRYLNDPPPIVKRPAARSVLDRDEPQFDAAGNLIRSTVIDTSAS